MLEKRPSSGREIRVRRTRQVREPREFLLNVEREMALNRLLGLLEADEAQAQNVSEDENTEAMSRIARLHSARATYALATSTEMQRVNAGAWIRKRHAVRPQEKE